MEGAHEGTKTGVRIDTGRVGVRERSRERSRDIVTERVWVKGRKRFSCLSKRSSLEGHAGARDGVVGVVVLAGPDLARAGNATDSVDTRKLGAVDTALRGASTACCRMACERVIPCVPAEEENVHCSMLDWVSMHSKPFWPSIEQAVCDAGQTLRLKRASLRRARARPDGTVASWQVWPFWQMRSWPAAVWEHANIGSKLQSPPMVVTWAAQTPPW